MTHSRLAVLSTRVDAMDWQRAVNMLQSLRLKKNGSYIAFCNVHMAVTARTDDELAVALEEADVVLPDGAPIAWTLRRLGASHQERISGPDFMWKTLEIANERGLKASFYGGSQSTLAKLTMTIQTHFPNIKIGVAISPPFRTLTLSEQAYYITQINVAQTDFLFVGLGCPKQEKWMYQHKNSVNATMLGVGAAFDYHAGTITRAPKWMQGMGLEWLQRLLSEPKRLWKRYLVTNTLFIWHVTKQLLRRQASNFLIK